MLDPEIPVCSGLFRQRLIIKANLRARIAVKKPLLVIDSLVMNAITAKKLLDWCQKNQCFDKEYWKNWIFSHESTFELYPISVSECYREFVGNSEKSSLQKESEKH